MNTSQTKQHHLLPYIATTAYYLSFIILGLTTAASLWLVAGLGMAFGMGLFLPGVMATALALPLLDAMVPAGTAFSVVTDCVCPTGTRSLTPSASSSRMARGCAARAATRAPGRRCAWTVPAPRQSRQRPAVKR